MRIAAVLLITVWAAACASRASGPPVMTIDRSACTRCGMLISEPAHAAAIRLPDGSDHLFDDIGCLVAHAQQHPADGVQYWFHDAADGQWIAGTQPVFVTSASLRTPMGGGIVAYRDRDAAERLAAGQTGRVVNDIESLIAAAGGTK